MKLFCPPRFHRALIKAITFRCLITIPLAFSDTKAQAAHLTTEHDDYGDRQRLNPP